MNKILKTSVLLLTAVSLASCSLVYRPVKQEGVIFDQSKIAQIQVGQTKEQVVYLLGSPTLFKRYSADEWYYIERTVDSRGNATQKTYVVTFGKEGTVISAGYKQ